MKKTVLTFLFFTLSLVGFAQLTYEPNPILDKFVGTWVAKTGKKTITIVIKKIQVPVYTTKMDKLEGYLIHKDNGSIIESSATPSFINGINISDGGDLFKDKIFFLYYDKRKDKNGTLEINLSKSNPNEFTANLGEQRRHFKVVKSESKKPQKGFTLPEKLVFEKQL